MNTLHRQRTSGYAGLTSLFLLVAGIAQGCGNDNPEPTTPVVNGGTTNTGGTGGKGGKGGSGGDSGADNGGNDATGGTSATGGSTTGGSSAGGTGAKGGKGGSSTGGTGAKGGKGGSTSTGGTGDVGNEGGAANSGNEGGTGAVPVDCSQTGEGKDRCYPCAPTDGENVEFLNHCNGSECSPFDNSARIEGFNGTLPPL